MQLYVERSRVHWLGTFVHKCGSPSEFQKNLEANKDMANVTLLTH